MVAALDWRSLLSLMRGLGDETSLIRGIVGCAVKRTTSIWDFELTLEDGRGVLIHPDPSEPTIGARLAEPHPASGLTMLQSDAHGNVRLYEDKGVTTTLRFDAGEQTHLPTEQGITQWTKARAISKAGANATSASSSSAAFRPSTAAA